MELKEDCTCMHGFTVGRCYALHMGPFSLARQTKQPNKNRCENLCLEFGHTTILHV
jgi:hypothetical protein